MMASIYCARNQFSDSAGSQQELQHKIQQFPVDFLERYYAKMMDKNEKAIERRSKTCLRELFATIAAKLDEGSAYDISDSLLDLE